MKMSFVSWLAAINVILWKSVLIFASEYDFTIEVPPARMSCYFQTVTDPKFYHMEIDYQVIDGGDLNINFLLLFGGSVLVQDRMKNDASHRIDVTQQKGDFQLCFDNSFSYQERKVVFFEIFLYDQDGRLEELDYSKMAHGDLMKEVEQIGITAEEFSKSSTRIKSALNKAEHYQSLIRAVEAKDRAIMEANFKRVSFWSWVNAGIMIGVGCLQVYMIRSLFEDNSKLGRILRAGKN